MREKNTPRRDLLNEIGLENSIVFENPDYDSAIIGYDDASSRIIYDYEKMAEHLMDVDGMTYEEAVEFIDYNTCRAVPYFGSDAPIIVRSIEDYMDYTNSKKEKGFNSEDFVEECVAWIKEWFERNGKGCKAVIGLSGGKDSTVAAALCAKALGPENVIGVAMPSYMQGENEADEIAKYLGIQYLVCNIGDIYDSICVSAMDGLKTTLSDQTKQNIPPRARMSLLYAIAQTVNGRVVGTCNKSELYVGYATRYGDMASDFEPLGEITCNQVVKVGHSLGIPSKWIDKTPDDGLPNSEPDDEKFAKWGFSYKTLDDFLEKGSSGNLLIDNAIIKKHNETKFKLNLGEIFKY